jgi:hypothetical protein
VNYTGRQAGTPAGRLVGRHEHVDLGAVFTWHMRECCAPSPAKHMVALSLQLTTYDALTRCRPKAGSIAFFQLCVAAAAF